MNILIKYLKNHYNIILELILKSGLCINEDDKAKLFIFNNVSYTDTYKIQPNVYHYSQLKEKYRENIKITEKEV